MRKYKGRTVYTQAELERLKSKLPDETQWARELMAKHAVRQAARQALKGGVMLNKPESNPFMSDELKKMLEGFQQHQTANVRFQLAFEFAKILLPLRQEDGRHSAIAREAFQMAEAMLKAEREYAPKEKEKEKA